MADIDFTTDLRNGLKISLTNSPRSVSGNRALLNRFEITLMTKRRQYLVGDEVVIDSYGGDANRFVGIPRVLSDIQGISAALSITIDQTVESMQKDEPAGIPDTERIERAEITSINVIDDIVVSKIRVYPVEVESYDILEFNLPIIRVS